MVVASRRSFRQSGHVMHLARRSRLTITTCDGPAAEASPSPAPALNICRAASPGPAVGEAQETPVNAWISEPVDPQHKAVRRILLMNHDEAAGIRGRGSGESVI